MEYVSVRRKPRYSLAVDVEVNDLESEIPIIGKTKTLSMLGCSVDTVRSFPRRAGVRIKLSHNGENMRALARVIYSGSELGMGVAFTLVEPEDERILEWWIAEFLGNPIRVPAIGT